jgi:ketosteroid isomerase-like protein
MTSAREIVEKNYKTLEEAFRNGDAKSISLMYTEDAEMFIPGAPVFVGRLAIHEVWKNIIGSGGNTVRNVVGRYKRVGI